MILDDTRRRIPTTPLVLGLAGLVPFWGLTLAMPLSPVFGQDITALATALLTYGAVIVSFLGGIRWGLATAGPQPRVATHYAVAVLPSLLAWAALALPPRAGLAALGLLALGLGWVDQRLVREALAPPWYGRLRMILSAGAGVALLAAAGFVVLQG